MMFGMELGSAQPIGFQFLSIVIAVVGASVALLGVFNPGDIFDGAYEKRKNSKLGIASVANDAGSYRLGFVILGGFLAIVGVLSAIF